MPFPLARSTGEPNLDLTRAHEELVLPRRVAIRWDAFDRWRYDRTAVDEAALAWQTRAVQEYHSLALFTDLASSVHQLGAPLDWSGALARMIADEVRHTELCLRFAEMLGAPPPSIEPADLRLPVADHSLRAHVRRTIVAAFCIGETLSGRMFARCLRAATVPLAQNVIRAIAEDEAFHAKFGWEAAALLMREDGEGFETERGLLVAALPELFMHFRILCDADRGEAWAHDEDEADLEPNFGTLTPAGYARAFYDGMKEDVVPGLVAIGFPEAEECWAQVRRD